MPKHLFASGCSAPQYRSPSERLHELPNEGLIKALKDYNGTPAEILENRELIELMLPTIRADFGLVADYQYRPDLPLNIPITVLAGKIDDRVSLAQVNGWQKETTNTCKVQWFEGDHRYL